MSQLVLRHVSEGITPTGIEILYAGVFFGADVPNGGFGFDENAAEALHVAVPSGSTVSQINSAIRTAANAKAAALGLTIDTNGIFVPGFTKD